MSSIATLKNDINGEDCVINGTCTSFHALKNYISNDWRDLVIYNDTVYNRILIHSEEKFEIILICWKKGQRSKIHDHPENGCILKVLSGELRETRYKFINSNLTEMSNGIIYTGGISYIKGSTGLHDIEALEDSVSLHIYSPPSYIAKIY
jgi:cysteine dioxygenase